jgi:hypothetical protein
VPSFPRALAALLLVSLPARAGTLLQGTLTLGAGYDDRPPSATGASGGEFFLDARPGLALTVIGPRAALHLAYTFDGYLYLGDSISTTYLNRFEATLFAEPTPLSRLYLLANASQGAVANLSTAQPTALTAPTGLPTGSGEYFTARAQDRIDRELTPLWRIAHTGSFAAYLPYGGAPQARSYDLDQSFLVEKQWKNDLGIGDLRVDYIDYTAIPGVTGIGSLPRHQVLAALTAKWRHDFGRFFATELDAGALAALRVDGGGRVFQPVGLAALRYARSEAQAELSYSHTVVSNVYLGETFATDSVSLHGAVPIPLGRAMVLTFGASIGWQQAQIVDVDSGALANTLRLWLGDASLTWMIRPELQIVARYQYVNQSSDSGTMAALPTFARNLFMLGFTGVYPPSSGPAVPRGPGLRADGSDGKTLPELHAPEAQ